MKGVEQVGTEAAAAELAGPAREIGLASRSLQLRRIGMNLVGVMAINLLALVTGPILARALGPTSRGVLAAVMLWPGLMQAVFSLGITDSLMYFTSGETISPRAIWDGAGRLLLLQGAAIWVVGLPVVYVVLHRFGTSALESSLIYLAATAPTLYGLYMLYFLNGLHRYAWFSAIQLAGFVVNAAALAGLWLAGDLTILTATLASIGASMSMLVIAFPAVRRSLGERRGARESQVARRLFRFGIRSHLSSFPHLLNDRVDQLVMTIFIPAHQLGLYVIAATVATAPAFVGAAISTSVLPTVAALRSVEEQVKAARRGVVITFVLTSSAAVVLAVGMSPIIRIVFGKAFMGSVPSARVLAFAAVMISLARTFQSLNKGIGRPLDAAMSEGGALVITGIGLAVLLGPLGIMGAAITSICAYTTSVLIGAGLAARALGVRPLEFLIPRRPASSQPGQRESV